MAKLYCETALPEKKEKERRWMELMDPKSKYSKK
jgi:hypothetical protein